MNKKIIEIEVEPIEIGKMTFLKNLKGKKDFFSAELTVRIMNIDDFNILCDNFFKAETKLLKEYKKCCKIKIEKYSKKSERRRR
ncbi:MAG: hypothetical protein PHE43_04685 [Candidatus Nanoarchaeia archaeon]|nr:hypothetical protein [Candidatus Nanoarchaeia archaeon]